MTQIIDDLQLFSKFRLKSDGVLLGCLHGLGQDCLLVPCVTSHFQDLRWDIFVADTYHCCAINFLILGFESAMFEKKKDEKKKKW